MSELLTYLAFTAGIIYIMAQSAIERARYHNEREKIRRKIGDIRSGRDG